MKEEEINELRELTASLKLSIILREVPGGVDLYLAYLAGVTDYREHMIKKLARAILKRDPIYTDDIKYEDGRVSEIGGWKVNEHTRSGMPARINGRKVEYGIFGTPVRIDGLFDDRPHSPGLEPSSYRLLRRFPWDK